MPMQIADLENFKQAGISGVILEVQRATPLVARTAVVPVNDVLINVPVITKDISGVFRKPYQGKDSRYEPEKRPVQLQFCDCSFSIDQQVIMSDPQGIDASCARAADSAMRGALLSLENAAFNGVYDEDNNLIFKGLKQSIDEAHTVDAGGTGDDVTDAYILNDAAVSLFVAGGDKFHAGEIEKTQVTDEAGRPYFVFSQNLVWYAALCAVNKWAMARIKNISKEKKLTDDMMYEAMSRLDASYPPTACYLSNTGVRQLQITRTISSTTGAPAPFPVDVSGTPIFVSSAIAVL